MSAGTPGQPSSDTTGLPDRIAAVRIRIARACERARRDPASVRLVAVSKTFPAGAVIAAAAAGVTDFGENRVQEALPKIHELRALGVGVTWHLIGHLQSNKVRAAESAFDILQAVDSERLLTAVARVAERPARIMLEVNAGGEASKFGVTPAALPSLLALAQSLPGVSVEGLMTVAPNSPDSAAVRSVFRAVHDLGEEHGLASLSMGMSNDFEMAIEEGATHVRIGRAIFGERL